MWNSLEWVSWWAGFGRGATALLVVLAALAGLATWFLGTRETTLREKRTESLEQELGDAASQLEALKEVQSTRQIDPNQRVPLVEALREHAGQAVAVSPVTADAEIVAYAKDIQAVLSDAGWMVTFQQIMMLSRPVTELEVGVSTPEEPPAAATALIDAFRAAGAVIEPGSHWAAPGAPISMKVGQKQKQGMR